MKFLHLTDLFAPSIGGTETAVRGLAREQLRRGHEVVVVTMRGAQPASSATEDTGYTVHRIDGGLQRFQRAWESADKPYHPPFPDPVVARTIARIVDEERPDVVHAHNWIVYSYLAVKTAARPPVIWTLHDNSLTCPRRTHFYYEAPHRCPGASVAHCLPCSAAQYGRPKAAAISLGLFASNATLLGRCDAFTASASSVIARATDRVGDAARVSFLAGFTPTLGEPDDPSYRPAFLPPDDGYVLFVGALGIHKGIFELLDAYRCMDDPPVLVVIGTPRHDSPEAWPDGVVRAQDASPRDVAAAWRHSAFGVVPSVCEEGFGLAVLEAGAQGRCVVASRIGGLADLVLDEETGLLVAPGDVAALAAAIGRLAEDPALRARLGDAARLRAATYTVGAVADGIESLAGSLVASRRR